VFFGFSFVSHIFYTVGIPSYLYSMRHLLVKENADAGLRKASTEQSIHAACAKVLSLEVDDIEDDIPLSSYGLDSLTSVRLSGILKQYFDTTVTQLQLLSSHMTGMIFRSVNDSRTKFIKPWNMISRETAVDARGTAPCI
jgi:acyl carrier protein